MRIFGSFFNLHKHLKQRLFTILAAFMVSFLVIRFFSNELGGSIFIRGYQIHHFYFGVLFLTVGGIIGTMSNHQPFLRIAAAYIGVGLGLFADEIGLLLNCTTEHSRNCTYAFDDPYLIMGTIAAILVGLIAASDEITKFTDNLLEKMNKPLPLRKKRREK